MGPVFRRDPALSTLIGFGTSVSERVLKVDGDLDHYPLPVVRYTVVALDMFVTAAVRNIIRSQCRPIVVNSTVFVYFGSVFYSYEKFRRGESILSMKKGFISFAMEAVSVVVKIEG
ncbi:unnamed protein product [Sphacelaria rigidula]